MSFIDLNLLKNEAKILKKQLEKHGVLISLNESRELVAKSAGEQSWNGLYLKDVKQKKAKRTCEPFYKELCHDAFLRARRLSESLIGLFPQLNEGGERGPIAIIMLEVMSVAMGVDRIMYEQEKPQECSITPSMMTSSRWKGGLGIIGNTKSDYLQTMLNWTLPWLCQRGGIVFICQDQLADLQDSIQKTATLLPLRVVDLTSPPFVLEEEQFEVGKLDIPGAARLATRTAFPEEMGYFWLAAKPNKSLWDNRAYSFISSLSIARNAYKKIFNLETPVECLTFNGVLDLAYNAELPKSSRSRLIEFLAYHFNVSSVEDRNNASLSRQYSEQILYSFASEAKWIFDVVLDASQEKSEIPSVYLEDLLQEKAITIFVAPNTSQQAAVEPRKNDYFSIMKNGILGLFNAPKTIKRKDTPLLVSGCDISLFQHAYPMRDQISTIRHSGWGWLTQIELTNSLSGVTPETEDLLNIVEGTLQIGGQTLPIFREIEEGTLPLWRDQRKACMTPTWGINQNPWVQLASCPNKTSNN